MAQLWGGRFTKETDKLVYNFNASISFDKRFYEQDIQGSKAHVMMLAKQGILTDDEKQQILDGLESIRKDVENGKLEITEEYEDIHSFVEANLIDRIGDAGKKLHTGRSRNDQVALDMKLYIRDEVQETDAQRQIDADVSAWGVYQVSHSHLAPTAIKNLLLNTAEYFGLTSGELTITGQDDSITTFQSNGESESWRITFLVDSNIGQSYLIFHTDNIEAVDRIHTFYNDLNIDETVSVEADLSLHTAESVMQKKTHPAEMKKISDTDLSEQPSGKDTLLEKLLAELPVTGLTQTPDGWYGRLNSNVHLSDLAANKNVRLLLSYNETFRPYALKV